MILLNTLSRNHFKWNQFYSSFEIKDNSPFFFLKFFSKTIQVSVVGCGGHMDSKYSRKSITPPISIISWRCILREMPKQHSKAFHWGKRISAFSLINIQAYENKKGNLFFFCGILNHQNFFAGRFHDSTLTTLINFVSLFSLLPSKVG